MILLLCFMIIISTQNVEMLKILQLSDFHYDINYNVDGIAKQMCHLSSSFGHDKLGKYGSYSCDSPLLLIQSALKNAKRIIPNPELILWTGDNVPHIKGYNTSYVVNAINVTTLLIKQYFPNTRILPVFGNHDYSPANSFPDNGSTIYSETYKIWKDFVEEDQKDTFLKAGYYLYQPKDMNNITFLMLNTNLYYKENKAKKSSANDPGNQFEFMEKVLKDAESENRLVHIIAHIAPGAFERTPKFFWMPNNFNKKLLDITKKYSKTIKWMIFGHHHTDTFHIVKDSGGNPVQLMLMSPAVTPWFSSLSGAGSNNPAFRVIEYNRTTWDYIDIKTYYIDLDQLNEGNMTDWELEYSMINDYGLKAINPQTMYELLQQMKGQQSVFLKYIQYNSVFWKPQLPQGEYRLAQLCSIEYPDYNNYCTCMNNNGNVHNFSFFIFLCFLIVTIYV